MSKSTTAVSGDLLKGLTRKSSKGDGIATAPGNTINDFGSRTATPKVAAPGGRVA